MLIACHAVPQRRRLCLEPPQHRIGIAVFPRAAQKSQDVHALLRTGKLVVESGPTTVGRWIMLIATLDDGVELRLLELRHAAEYYRLVSDNYERLYWLPAEPTPESTERRLRGGLARFAEGAGVDAGIWDHGVLCGFVGLFDIDSSFLSAEIGYWIDKGSEGRGLMTRAARAMLSTPSTN